MTSNITFADKSSLNEYQDAFVPFLSSNDVELALTKDRKMIGNKFVKLFRSSVEQMEFYCNKSINELKIEPKVIEKSTSEMIIKEISHVIITNNQNAEEEFLPLIQLNDSFKFFIKISNLPRTITKKKIIETFHDVNIENDYNGIYFVVNKTINMPNEVYIQLKSEEDVQKMHTYNLKKINGFYIFLSKLK